MAISQRLDLRQAQTLVMTPQLQQAIKLLQMSNQELGDFVAQEVEQNPLLERAEDGGDPEVLAENIATSPDDRENFAASSVSANADPAPLSGNDADTTTPVASDDASGDDV